MARVLHGALLALAVCCVLTAPSAQERPARVALFIGNATYPDAGKPLTTPVNDARALAEAFRRLDFDTTLKENLGKQDLRGAIDAFVSSIRPGSLALIYFAGYGLQAGNQTYLMPVDAAIWAEADIQREAISLETVVAQLHERGARSKIVIIDAAASVMSPPDWRRLAGRLAHSPFIRPRPAPASRSRPATAACLPRSC
jgi:hypothetical protein